MEVTGTGKIGGARQPRWYQLSQSSFHRGHRYRQNRRCAPATVVSTVAILFPSRSPVPGIASAGRWTATTASQSSFHRGHRYRALAISPATTASLCRNPLSIEVTGTGWLCWNAKKLDSLPVAILFPSRSPVPVLRAQFIGLIEHSRNPLSIEVTGTGVESFVAVKEMLEVAILFPSRSPVPALG